MELLIALIKGTVCVICGLVFAVLFTLFMNKKPALASVILIICLIAVFTLKFYFN